MQLLFGKLFFAFWVIVHPYPFLKGLMGKQDRAPTIIVVWSILLASICSLMWVRINPFIPKYDGPSLEVCGLDCDWDVNWVLLVFMFGEFYWMNYHWSLMVSMLMCFTGCLFQKDLAVLNPVFWFEMWINNCVCNHVNWSETPLRLRWVFIGERWNIILSARLYKSVVLWYVICETFSRFLHWKHGTKK